MFVKVLFFLKIKSLSLSYFHMLKWGEMTVKYDASQSTIALCGGWYFRNSWK